MNAIYLVLVICTSFSICAANEENRWFNGLFGPSVNFGAHAQLGQLDHGGPSHQLEQNAGHRHYRHYVNLEACECLQVIGQESAAATTTAGSTTTAAGAPTTAATTTATGAATTTATGATTTTPYWMSWTTTAPYWSWTTAPTIGYWTTAAARTSAPPAGRRRRAMASNQIPTQDRPDVNDASIERAVLDFYNGMPNKFPQGGHFDGADEYLSNMDLHNDHHHHAEAHHHSQSEEIIPNPAPFVAPAEYVPNTADDFIHYRRQPGFRNPYTGECVCSQAVSTSTPEVSTTRTTTAATTTTATTTTATTTPTTTTTAMAG